MRRIWFASVVCAVSLAGCADDLAPTVEKAASTEPVATTAVERPPASPIVSPTTSTTVVGQQEPSNYLPRAREVVGLIQGQSAGGLLDRDVSLSFIDDSTDEHRTFRADRLGAIEHDPDGSGFWSGWDVVGERRDQDTTTDVLAGFGLFTVIQSPHGITDVLTDDGRDAVAGRRVLNVEFFSGGRLVFTELEADDVNETNRVTSTDSQHGDSDVRWSRTFDGPVTFFTVLDMDGRHVLVGVGDRSVASPGTAELHIVDGRTGETLESMVSPKGLRAVWTPTAPCDEKEQLRPGGQYWAAGTETLALYECDESGVVSAVRQAGLPELFFAIDSNGDGFDEVFVGGTFGHGHGAHGFTRVGEELLPILDEQGNSFGPELHYWDNRWIRNSGCIDGNLAIIDIRYSDTEVSSTARLYRIDDAQAVLIETLPEERGPIEDYLDDEGLIAVGFPMSDRLRPIVECDQNAASPTSVETNFVLHVDGIGEANFGDGPDEAIAVLTELAGAPTFDQGWVPACVGSRPTRSVIWELEDGGRGSRLWLEFVADEIDWKGNLVAEDSQIVNPKFVAYSYGYFAQAVPGEITGPPQFGIDGGVALETTLAQLEDLLGEVTLIRGNDAVHQYWLTDNFGGDVWPNDPDLDRHITGIRAGENREGTPC